MGPARGQARLGAPSPRDAGLCPDVSRAECTRGFKSKYACCCTNIFLKFQVRKKEKKNCLKIFHSKIISDKALDFSPFPRLLSSLSAARRGGDGQRNEDGGGEPEPARSLFPRADPLMPSSRGQNQKLNKGSGRLELRRSFASAWSPRAPSGSRRLGPPPGPPSPWPGLGLESWGAGRPHLVSRLPSFKWERE